MAVYYKFKSAKDYDSIAIDGHFISVGNLKDKIVEKKNLGRGTDFDLLISNAQTDEDYNDEAQMVPKNTSVLVRRVPGRRQKPIVAEVRDEKKNLEKLKDEALPAKPEVKVPHVLQSKQSEESDWADEFGVDLYAMPEQPPPQQLAPQQLPVVDKSEEDHRIKAFVDASASDWQRQTQESISAGRGFGRGMQGRGAGGRGFGRGLERKNLPPGYVCHRCGVPGHFIQHCPTNGDPAYDMKKMKPPTGIPKSMLVANPDGSYALPSGGVAVLRPNDAVFEKEIEGLPVTKSVADIPPELCCPLCRGVLKDAVLTSKCCFKSYCDKCIRDQILSKGKCVCGAMNILADDLLPNKTLRDAINRLLETTTATSSAEHAGSLLHVQDMESAQRPKPKAPSPSASGSHKNLADRLNSKEQVVVSAPSFRQSQQSPSKVSNKRLESFEQTAESMSRQELPSQGEFLGSQSTPRVEEEVQQETLAAKKRKLKSKQRPRPVNGEREMHQRPPSFDYSTNDAGMMPYPGNPAYGAYWGGPQWLVDGFGQPYLGNPQFSYMGYGVPGPIEMHYGGGLIMPDTIGPTFMPSIPSFPRECMDGSFGPGSSLMSREEFEARKAELKRKKEMERLSYTDDAKDNARESGSGDPGSSKLKRVSNLTRSPASSQLEVMSDTNDDVQKGYIAHARGVGASSSSPRFSRKRRQERREEAEAEMDERVSLDADNNYTHLKGVEASDKKPKVSVFSRIRFPEKSKKTSTEKHGDGSDGDGNPLRNRRGVGLADRLGSERQPANVVSLDVSKYGSYDLVKPSPAKKSSYKEERLRQTNRSKILEGVDNDDDVHEPNFKRESSYPTSSHDVYPRGGKRRQS